MANNKEKNLIGLIKKVSIGKYTLEHSRFPDGVLPGLLRDSFDVVFSTDKIGKNVIPCFPPIKATKNSEYYCSFNDYTKKEMLEFLRERIKELNLA